MRLRVTHKTIYDYSETVSLCHSLVHLRPRPTDRQSLAEHELWIDPPPSILSESSDYHGNPVARFAVQIPHRSLTLSAVSEVEVRPRPPGNLFSPAWETVRDALAAAADADTIHASQFVFDSPHVRVADAIRSYAASSFEPGRPCLDAARDLMRRLHRDIAYAPGSTSVATTVEQVLIHRQGVCQDLAHLLIACLRSHGLAARYVSGYLLTQPPPGKPRLVGADASHAWVGVYCSGSGWVDLDPTNNLEPSDQHVTAAWGRDYEEVSPVRGVVLGGGQHEVRVAVDVTPI